MIAEVGQNHGGCIKSAHSYIETAAACGADAVKFQTHLAQAESTLEEPFRIPSQLAKETRFDYWKRMEFKFSEWEELASHAKEAGLIFLSSPFSEAAVDLLNDLKIPAWKIGSGEAFSNAILKYILEKTTGPILLSSGLCSWRELDERVSSILEYRRALILLHCVSKYPTPLEQTGIQQMEAMAKRYSVPCGLSDHSGTPFPALGAIVLGAPVIELHLIQDKSSGSLDASSSLTASEFAQVSDFNKAWDKIKTSKNDRDMLDDQLKQMREIFGKSLALVRPCRAGTILTAELVTLKKPGTGIPGYRLKEFLGKKLIKDKEANRLLKKEDFA